MIETVVSFEADVFESEDGQWIVRDIPLLDERFPNEQELERKMTRHVNELGQLLTDLGLVRSIGNLIQYQLTQCGWADLDLHMDLKAGLVEFPTGQILDVGQCVLFLTWASRLAASQRAGVEKLVTHWQRERLVDL